MKTIAEKGAIHGLSRIPEDVQKLFVTAHDIEAAWHVKMQSAFQKYTHNAVSKTVNLPQEATIEDVKTIYMLAYETGCKGVTIYRDNSRAEQVLSIPSAAKAQEEKTAPAPVKAIPRPRPTVISGTTTKIATGCGNLYVTINEDEKGMPFEVFMSMGKAGGCAMSQLEAMGRLVSLAMRSGIDAISIAEQLRGIRCPSPSWEKGGRIFSCSDAIARVIERRVQSKAKNAPKTGSLDATEVEEKQDKVIERAERAEGAGMPALSKATTSKIGNIVGVCPDCGCALWHVEGCNVCSTCGYSKCG
jgi:ribonucleoside-diphosphate reductase alpha chain